MTSNQTPEGYELLPAPFLREHGAVEGMRWRNRHCPDHEWSDWKKTLGHLCLTDVLATTDFEFCAPMGTIAAATTPLPEPRCDCGTSVTTRHFQTCPIHLRYRHILPGELAKLPTKPEGLLMGAKNRQVRWQPYAAEWPIPLVWAGDFAYALPLPPQPDKEELPNAECPHCSGWNHVSKIYCHNCGGKLPAHPDLSPPQPEKGKGGEEELRELKRKYADAINFIKTLNAKTGAHGREYRSACGRFLAQLQKLP